MSTCFRSGQICRWHQASYRPVCQEGKCYAGAEGYEPELWSVDKFDEIANKVEQDEHDDTLGIKGRCTCHTAQLGVGRVVEGQGGQCLAQLSSALGGKGDIMPCHAVHRKGAGLAEKHCSTEGGRYEQKVNTERE